MKKWFSIVGLVGVVILALSLFVNPILDYKKGTEASEVLVYNQPSPLDEEVSPALFEELRKQIGIFLAEQEEARKKGLQKEEVIREEVSPGQFTAEQIKSMEEQIEKLQREQKEFWERLIRENEARRIEIAKSWEQ